MAIDAQSLALQRTFLAHERTLMAWVRTSTSLISFGFSVYKFFAYLRATEHRIPQRFGPREFAITMIGIGVVALALAVVQQRRAFKLLEAENKTGFSSLAEKFAAVIACLGSFLLIAVVLRW